MSSAPAAPPTAVGGRVRPRPADRSWISPTTVRPASEIVGVIGLGLLLLAVPLVGWSAIRVLPNMTYGDPLFALATVAAVIVQLDRRAPRAQVPGWLWIVSGVIMAAGLIATFRTSTDGNIVPLVRMVATLAVLPPVMATLLSTRRRISIALELWMVGAATSAVVGLLDLQLGLGINVDLTGFEFVRYSDRAAGLTVHPNHLGLASAMAFPVAALLATRAVITGRSRLEAARFAFYALLLIAGILVSGSRTAPVAAILGVIAALLVAEPRLRSPVLAAGIVTIVLALGFLVVAGSSGGGLVVVERLAGDSSAQGSDAERSAVYSSARTDIEANPFVGEGFAVVRTAHVLYLQLIQAGGILCALAFGFMFLAYLSDARWLARLRSVAPRDRVLAAGLAGGVAAWALAGFVSNSVYDRYLYLPFGLLLAMRALAIRGELGDEGAAEGRTTAVGDGRPA